MLARLRALLGFVLLAGLLAFPAAAWNAHLLSSPVAVDAHHHHDAPADEAHAPDHAHDDGSGAGAAPASHEDGDGGHTHLPSASASMDAQLPAAFVPPAPFAQMVAFGANVDVTRHGQAAPPQKRPPRLG